MNYKYAVLLSFFSLCGDSSIDRYKDLLEFYTYEGQDWSRFQILPKSRYVTFKRSFDELRKNRGSVIVELGTSRSFVHGGLVGCNSNDTSYWDPAHPEKWDWGAGFFTRVAAEEFLGEDIILHTVDLAKDHLERCKIITADFSAKIRYHHTSSLDFLRTYNGPAIDLLYMDTGDMTPIEPTALLHLEEVKIVVERQLIPIGGLILIDDVRNQTPYLFGDRSGLGKDKYSIPYLLSNGFEIVEDEYQVLLRRAY